MRPDNYDVRLWTTEQYTGARGTTWTVLWRVGTRRHRRPFRTAAAADSFRSELVVAARRGEAFDVATGLPLAALREQRSTVSWYRFACDYADHKWKDASPHHRKGIAEALAVGDPKDRALLAAVATTPRSGPHLHAFFALLYYAALRPEEAVDLRAQDLDLPADDGWGWITVRTAAPEAGSAWTDTRTPRQQRHLKHRAPTDTRPVPSPPDLTAILRSHLAGAPDADDQPLFHGERGGPLASVTYLRLWHRAREQALGPAATGPLARRPYDLRHAAVSTWLAAGVPPTQVAQWAGHSTDVLLRVYAHALDGHQQQALDRIQNTLRPAAPPPAPSTDALRRRTRRGPRRRP